MFTNKYIKPSVDGIISYYVLAKHQKISYRDSLFINCKQV